MTSFGYHAVMLGLGKGHDNGGSDGGGGHSRADRQVLTGTKRISGSDCQLIADGRPGTRH